MRKLSAILVTLFVVLFLGTMTVATPASAGPSPYKATIKISHGTCDIAATVSWTSIPSGATYISLDILQDTTPFGGGWGQSSSLVGMEQSWTVTNTAPADGIAHTYKVVAGFGTAFWDDSLGSVSSRTVKFTCR